eukprot:m.213180 g.213180  ORF g.213180 m.213180 type:complete len:124 (-) comp15859_c0_seq10:996-1367(-)
MTPGISKETAQQEKFQLLLASAELGFPRAMNDVGTLYNTGAGVELNETTARFWFQRAANEGHADAFYNEGLFELENPDRAVELFQIAAKLGSREPFYNLGVAYARLTSSIYWDVRWRFGGVQE